MLDVKASLEMPKTAEALQAVVAAAGAAGRTLEVRGGGTKRPVGGGRPTGLTLSTAALKRVVDYAPEELVLTAQAGCRLADLERLVASEGQMLPFEPPRLCKLLGTKGEPTLGGALAANLSGPRRIRAGAARDHFLGFEAVSGRGERFKAGGKVVKNVTGYDLMKLMAGSWGTLVVLTEVTIKVLPAPKTEATLLLFGLDEARGVEAMTRALQGPFEVSGAAHLPPFAAGLPPLKLGTSATVLRLDGFEASTAARLEALIAALKGFGRAEALDAEHSRDLWAQIREVEAFARDPRPLWRLSVPPAAGWRAGTTGDALYDWAGGLVWLLTDEDPAAVKARARALGGHATPVRGGPPAALEPALAALHGRVKAAFDPLGVLNPGRMGFA